MNRRCKHPEVQQYWRWFGTWIDHLPRVQSLFRLFEGPDAEVCTVCGAWLPMGPANNKDPRVKQEIRVARHRTVG
jgi:hypothetical protein